jgi:hypothetical protein
MKVRFFASTFCFFLSPPWKENYDEKDKKTKQEEKPVIYIHRPSKNLVKFRKYMVKSRNVCKNCFILLLIS